MGPVRNIIFLGVIACILISSSAVTLFPLSNPRCGDVVDADAALISWDAFDEAGQQAHCCRHQNCSLSICFTTHRVKSPLSLDSSLTTSRLSVDILIDGQIVATVQRPHFIDPHTARPSSSSSVQFSQSVTDHPCYPAVAHFYRTRRRYTALICCCSGTLMTFAPISQAPTSYRLHFQHGGQWKTTHQLCIFLQKKICRWMLWYSYSRPPLS
jgi:hypothetical protein